MTKKEFRHYLSAPFVVQEDLEAVSNALASGWVAPVGPHLLAFEQSVANFVGTEHAVALSSGTAAIHLGLLAMGVQPGDVILTSTLTFAATAFPARYVGARILLADVDSDWNLDVECVSRAIDFAKRKLKPIRVVIPVDLYGRCADYQNLMPLFNDAGITVLEDAAEALGAKSEGTQAGAFGDVGVFSFNGNKIITSSGGGMLLTNDGEIASHVRKMSTQARERVHWYEHREVGYNYRLSNILAALGNSQFDRLDSIVEAKRRIRSLYAQNLAGLEGVRIKDSDNQNTNAWLSIMILDESQRAGLRDHVYTDLHDLGYECRFIWKPLHEQPTFKDCSAFLNGNAAAAFERGLCLPSSVGMSEEDVEQVCNSIIQTVTRF